MPWCPKCKNEYYAGIKYCADCNTELVESLEAYEEEQKTLLEESDNSLEFDENIWEEELSGEESDMATMEMLSDEIIAARNASTKQHVYRNYKEKAADNKSSAYSLISVGGLGIIFIILALADIISLPISGTNEVMIYGVMGTLFVIFVVMGLVSLNNAKKYALKALQEDELTKEIKEWCMANLSKETIDQGLWSEEEADLEEELKYFKRFEKMREQISSNFLNLDEAFLSRFLDEYYQSVFSDGDE